MGARNGIPAERSLRIATWNIHHGAGLDGRVDLGRVALTLKLLRADVIGLQEVDRNLARSGHVDQAAVLAELLGMEVAFRSTLDIDGGSYGLAIASSTLTGVDLELLPGRRGGEPRGVLIATAHGMSVLVTHLSRYRAARVIQLRRLAEAVRRVDPPVTLVGDLNQGRWGLGSLRRVGLRAPRRTLRTAPAAKPLRQIDHILGGSGVRIDRVTTWATEASDHLPLVASLRTSGRVTDE